MSSTLCATAASFIPRSRLPSTNSTDLLGTVVFREINDIGTFKDGILIPRKNVASQITWQETTSSAEAEPTVTSAAYDESAAAEPMAPLADSEVVEMIPAESPEDTGEVLLDSYEDTTDLAVTTPVPYYQQAPTAFGMTTVHASFKPAPAAYPQPALPQIFYSRPATHIHTAADVPVADAYRPRWDPAYHKAISPNIERANEVVEEFRVYYGNGRSQHPTMRLEELKKICYMCGFNQPLSVDGCLAILRNTYMNVFDLVAAGGGKMAVPIPTFRSSKAFFDYCVAEEKICPRWIGKANPLFQEVMNRFR